MKILHTSDWHIGKKLYKKDLEDDHLFFIDWIMEYIENEAIDVLIVAGDIFDIAFPSNSSLKIYYDFLRKLIKTGCQSVFIIGGNHDSVSTLEAPKEILKFLNVNVIGGIPEKMEELIFTVKSKKNSVNICAVPFLRDSDIRKSAAGESYEERKKALQSGISNYYENIANIIEKKANGFPSIVTGHLFMTGVSKSDSERDIHIGNMDGIRASSLPSTFDYWALGHIHRPQVVDNKDFIRYSGSPLPLSFSERNDKKQLVLITVSENKISKISPVEVPIYRKLIRISGTFNEVVEKIEAYPAVGNIKDRADIIIMEATYDPSLVRRFEEFVKQLDTIEILNYKIQFKNKIIGTDDLFDGKMNLNELKVSDVFTKRLEKENISPENRKELWLAFQEVLEEVNNL